MSAVLSWVRRDLLFLFRFSHAPLAPEGISCVGLSSPQRLKAIHLDCSMYGLKAVPLCA